jgi:asparagine synthase (glutamine-hydrolysing)
VALSGGIDSASVACAVRHLEPDAEINSFSFVAKDSAVSEESWMRLVIERAKLTPHFVMTGAEELRADLDAMILNLGEPFGSTSIYAQRRVFQLARERGVVVTLDGQGADELFAGYQGYPGPRTASLLLKGELLGAARFFNAAVKWPDRPKGETLRRVLREFTPESLIAFGLRLAGRDPAPAWLKTAELKERGVKFGLVDARAKLYPSNDRVRRTLAYQLTWNGLPQLLRHGDRNSMAFSIESRVPFLTREMAELALSLPEEHLVDMGGRSKAVFREAMRGIVPDGILDRRDKIGFATPESQWLSSLGGWVDESLARAEGIPFIELDAARREWAAIQEGKAPFDWRVWRWLNYVKWAELFEVVP